MMTFVSFKKKLFLDKQILVCIFGWKAVLFKLLRLTTVECM